MRYEVLTREEIDEFKRITFETKGVRLTDEKALDQGLRLVVLLDLLIKREHRVENSAVATRKSEEENK